MALIALLAAAAFALQPAGTFHDGQSRARDGLFAGDLGRDGRLDLSLATTGHDNVGRPTLFLPSRARDGELARAVAVHSSVGC
jgi:hypothetical protein